MNVNIYQINYKELDKLVETNIYAYNLILTLLNERKRELNDKMLSQIPVLAYKERQNFNKKYKTSCII
tara:strand:- start:162 stop:365 length:204 start_codon:yes stop_codon:yes gene_type:complete